MGARWADPFFEKNAKSVPGAGAYSLNNSLLKAAPQYKFGTSNRDDNKSKSPKADPGSYNPSTSLTKPQAPGYKAGTGQRNTFDEKTSKSIPGPGNYAPKTPEAAPKFSMGIRLKDQSKMQTPGAGTYEPVGQTLKTKYPVYSMGAKLPTELDKSPTKFVPGPGQYVNSAEKLRQTSPSFGFGTMQRPDIAKKSSNPGPGTYELKSTIAEATSHLNKN